jgi:transcriptional regulator with XRE-family HTH domain
MPDPQNLVVGDSGSINPRALAEQLDISLAELARLVGVSRSTLAAEPLGKKGHEALAQLVRLLAFATEMAGSLEAAVEWFKHTPVVSMGTKTAMEHVKDGKIEWVYRHLERIYHGAYA